MSRHFCAFPWPQIRGYSHSAALIRGEGNVQKKKRATGPECAAIISTPRTKTAIGSRMNAGAYIRHKVDAFGRETDASSFGLFEFPQTLAEPSAPGIRDVTLFFLYQSLGAMGRWGNSNSKLACVAYSISRENGDEWNLFGGIKLTPGRST